MTMDSFAIRAERVLAKVYRGIHHCPKIKKFQEGAEWEMWEVNHYGDLATYDSDELTRLVIASHDECIRASVNASGPRMVKIRLWPRAREGGLCLQHPTIEGALEYYRSRK